ncbi:MAG: tetratricopeptide repeat protein [Methanolobus sp.]|uniref:tetratricopeptide repeat protein n=1 Tax=Methanolobus sp. TaxID=1874737 RepID=UPI002730DAA1|nr:tetratricopeptide repeat protein [Methanolobus sp.]MDP2217610.1 tetratricopeptide repeat protein [Methanolobus sp.]
MDNTTDSTDPRERLLEDLRGLKQDFSKDPTMDNLFQIAVIYDALGQTERGIGFAEAFLMQIEDEMERLVMNTMVLSMVDRDDEAVKLLGKAEEKFPEDIRLKRYRGMLLNKQRKFAEAVDAFTTLLEKDSGDLEAVSGKIIALLGLKKHDQAMKAYQASISITPQEAPQWHFKGMLDGLMGEHLSRIQQNGLNEDHNKKLSESFMRINSLIDNFGPDVRNFYRMGQVAGKEAYHLTMDDAEEK